MHAPRLCDKLELIGKEPPVADTPMLSTPLDAAPRQTSGRWPLLVRMAVIFGGAAALWAGVFLMAARLR
jgi:hypothetical protein